tara:strand:- start:8340 stop:9101 length:762 start_codon:yes stop_codon:yes gene_type:complete
MNNTQLEHHLHSIYNSLDQINNYLDNENYRSTYRTYSEPYRGPYSTPSYRSTADSYSNTYTTPLYRSSTDPFRGPYSTHSESYRNPYTDLSNSSRSYNNTTRTTRFVEPETHGFHIRLNEPINLTDLPTPGSIASLFTNLNRENEQTNIKLINDNTEIITHTNEVPINCSICREDINRDDNIIRKINHCDHVFHQKCLDKWFETKKTCPICRYELTDTPTLTSNRTTNRTTNRNNINNSSINTSVNTSVNSLD